MNLLNTFQRQHPVFIFLQGVASVVLIGVFDLASGYEISLFILYGVPIYLVAWFLDRNFGVLLALICGLVWWWASVRGGQPYLNNWMQLWETFVRLGYFVFIAIGAASLKRGRDAAAARIVLLEHSYRLESDIVQISDREQRRIGRDLHDGLCQYQAALACAAVSLQDDLKLKAPEEAVRAGELAALLRGAVAQTRDLARGLVPVQMEDMGLFSALEELARSVSMLQSVRCRFEVEGDFPMLDNMAATHLYRIAQEAISNATRHGFAKNIEVTLSVEGATNVLRIQDDGWGISKTTPSAFGMGLSIMRYRARVAGGELLIDEPASGGTCVQCVMPASAGEIFHERAA